MSLACPRCKHPNGICIDYDDDSSQYFYSCAACGLACHASDLSLPELDWPKTASDYDIVNQMLDEASR